jgi:ribosomal protein S18 acetylase RimI-like enzyme
MFELAALTLLFAALADEGRRTVGQTLRRLTEEMLDEMQREGWYYGPSRERRHDRPTAYHINCGWCDEWADRAVELLGGYAYDLASHPELQSRVAHEHGLLPVPQEPQVWGHGHEYDRYMELIDLMPAHTVLWLNGRYYDSQHPDGVDSVFELDFLCHVPLEGYLAKAVEPLVSLEISDDEMVYVILRDPAGQEVVDAYLEIRWMSPTELRTELGKMRVDPDVVQESSGVVGYLTGFEIPEQYRGAGVGSRMLARALAQTAGRPVYLVSERRPSALYERQGFETVDYTAVGPVMRRG